MDIIDLLAAFPRRRFTLTEIARAIGVNLASCHAIVAELERRGYLCRHAALKTYWLGPALIAAEQPALLANPILARTKAVAGRLRRELGLPLLLSTIVGDDIVCILSLEDDAGHTAGLRPGDRVPLLPPIGMSFMAWAPAQEAQAWIARRAKGNAAHLAHSLAAVRRQGFHVTLRRPGGDDVVGLLARAANSDRTPDVRRQIAAFAERLDGDASQPDLHDATTAYDIQLIAAPVVDHDTLAIYNLGIGGFHQPLSGVEVAEAGRHLAAACLDIMEGPDRR